LIERGRFPLPRATLISCILRDSTSALISASLLSENSRKTILGTAFPRSCLVFAGLLHQLFVVRPDEKGAFSELREPRIRLDIFDLTGVPFLRMGTKALRALTTFYFGVHVGVLFLRRFSRLTRPGFSENFIGFWWYRRQVLDPRFNEC
jgi:hypothetical protein